LTYPQTLCVRNNTTRLLAFCSPLPAARHFSQSKNLYLLFFSLPARLVILSSSLVLDSSICSPFRYVDSQCLKWLWLIYSVQISFGSFVYPSLILAYLGQGARLAVNGADVLPNVFYLTIPGRHNGPLFWVQYVVAILATLIASQAMITATFSLVQQLLSMKCLPSYEPFSCGGIWLSSRPAFQATHGAYVGQNSGSSIYTHRKLAS
jgi:hypothetical protein